MPAKVDVEQRLQQYVQAEKHAPGAVVGIIDEQGSHVFAQGYCQAGGTNAVDADTLFEIGSVTKVFTALLLQEMVDDGEVKLDDPISKFLPPSVKAPTRNGREITLLDLATQSSGLPRLPDNMGKLYLLMHSDNPYAGYSADDLYSFLSHYQLRRDIGAEYEYSNVGYGLLGHVLSLKAGTNYEALVINRICRPLLMSSTTITLSPEFKARMATGHNEAGQPVSNWDFQALAGCGAIRSSLNDMLKFLSANLGLSPSPLADTIARVHVVRRDASAGQKIALAWHINTAGIHWHNGGTAGYRSFIGFDPQTRRGIVVLANSAHEVDSFALSLLRPAHEHALAQVDHSLYDRYLGEYKFTPRATLTISRDGDQFFARLTGQNRIEFFPESELDFFCKVVDAQLTFVKNAAGEVTAVILHQNGFDQIAQRAK